MTKNRLSTLRPSGHFLTSVSKGEFWKKLSYRKTRSDKRFWAHESSLKSSDFACFNGGTQIL